MTLIMMVRNHDGLDVYATGKSERENEENKNNNRCCVGRGRGHWECGLGHIGCRRE